MRQYHLMVIYIDVFLLSRAAIRKTWSNHMRFEYNSTSNMHQDVIFPFSDVLFLLGKPSTNSQNIDNISDYQNQIINESRIYDDILQVDIEETYHNCFYKSK